MTRRVSRPLFATILAVLVMALSGPTCRAQGAISALASPASDSPSPKKDGWVEERDEQARIQVMTMEMVLHPRAEPHPALKYRFLPDDFEQVEGNAAIYYLKAMGFLEQNPSRRHLDELWRQAEKQALAEGKRYDEVPPAVWRATPPAELPVEAVKEYLQATAFQSRILQEAARRNRFDLNRNLREVDDLFAYPLSEIQSLRELSRTQDLRCRVALAENRLDDAIRILGQQYALAHHLSQDEFIVSNLVGMACANIAWNQALHLVQHPDAPNLYWAFASLPRPLVDTARAMATERQLLYEQVKLLREVDEAPRSVGYWSDFVDRLVPQLGYLAEEMGLKLDEDQAVNRAKLVAYIAASYPGAKEYLVDVWGMPRVQLDACPTAQVVFLAVVRFYDQWRDEHFKWMCLPYWQARTFEDARARTEMERAASRAGWCAMPSRILLPAVTAARAAQARTDQMIALVQTVEAIRMYGALHDGRLPRTLQELPVPAPPDPLTGEPIDYQLVGHRAVLNGHPVPGLRYRLIVEFARDTP
jgi:hypothetical protein